MTIHKDINHFLFDFQSIDINDRKNFVEQHKDLIESIRWFELLNIIFNTITFKMYFLSFLIRSVLKEYIIYSYSQMRLFYNRFLC